MLGLCQFDERLRWQNHEWVFRFAALAEPISLIERHHSRCQCIEGDAEYADIPHEIAAAREQIAKKHRSDFSILKLVPHSKVVDIDEWYI